MTGDRVIQRRIRERRQMTNDKEYLLIQDKNILKYS